MATFRAAGERYQFNPGSGVGVTYAVPIPSGTQNGDTIFFLVEVAQAKKGTFAAAEGQTQVGSWVDGVTNEPTYGTPSSSVWKVVYDSGAGSSYNFTFNEDANRGGCIRAVGYSGDCTVQEILTSAAASASGARSGPVMDPATGNLVLAFFAGSAVSTPGVAWGNSFIERFDEEYYGLLSVGELAGDGTNKTPSLTPNEASQSMWHVLNVGPASALTLDNCLPDADVTTTGWTSTPLYSKVNDASDATVISATAS